jgi:hypothetical protein
MKSVRYVNYTISAGQIHDGKSVCLWRQEGSVHTKIARFQNKESARMFAFEFQFPLSEQVKQEIGESDA